MKVKFTNIIWDDENSMVELPEEYVIDIDDDVDVDTEGDEVLSDVFGWCVIAFDYEIID